jgi:hypothetical protein
MEQESAAAQLAAAKDELELTTAHARFNKNWQRANEFIGDIFEKSRTNAEITTREMDIIRSGVVFLHAAFEDFLRGTLRALLPKAGVEVLDAIPIAGSKPGQGAPNIKLGWLLKFSGISVDELISKSVGEWLNRRSFNDTDDVCSALRQMGVTKHDLKKYLPHIAFVMKRRHRIVHDADFEDHAALEPPVWDREDLGKPSN